ncbi:acyl-CoA-binding domain-containing protein 5-B-like isoform X1 [Nerophis lumbriciformis]|uniref:acyl-CoA-binding domain-containing protein 5-B-like isoform X1 n=2 Tax=Nerophis lumbriciformis TaxID=546530 RepID=UPI002ADFBD3B|nr:acyl-CoA-binding domain-containing protein 5-like isoform X1 [Nerophis lumbriciformis]XP_061790877.1 acyl-CoA-binding domain-containing protein 5-like isoform X1 [Nerophis lumbriciformis]XP_061790884.1 acyl-CoA-binding domain-containing protein 5-like isoform X1 [Nerophis lumbriciformis]
MAQEEDQHTLRAKFYAAVKVICSLPNEGPFQLSDDMMLMFFSYYMQATSGPCSYARPFGFWESQEQAKWDAWSSLGNMTKEDAMKHYVENIQLILETMPVSNEVAELVQKLGNFYTDVVEDEGERDEMDSRLFTRPFAQQADELVTPRKPAMEGYGDLWNDIQNVQEKDSVQSVSFNPVEDANEYLGEEDIHEEETDNDEDKSDIKEWSLEDKEWRCDTRTYSSGLELSTSSSTNAHSSLNSEVEEEELVCFTEPSIRCIPTDMHFSGPVSDQKYIKKHYPPADSDHEEFCDSSEHVTMDKTLPTSAVSPAASVREQELWFESSSALKAEDGSLLKRESCVQEPHNATFIRESPMTACNSQSWLPACDGVSPCAHSAALPPACDGVSPCTRSSGASWGNVNEQIAAALFRLQDDMAHVLHRLHTLEELSVAQVKESRSSSLRCEDSRPAAHKFSLQFRKPSWWPFDHSPVTVVMTALWPAIAYGLVQLYSRRKRRKMT